MQDTHPWLYTRTNVPNEHTLSRDILKDAYELRVCACASRAPQTAARRNAEGWLVGRERRIAELSRQYRTKIKEGLESGGARGGRTD